MAISDDDRRLVAQARQGDHAAFAALVERRQADVAKMMWRFTRDRDEHADLTHEVFVQFYLALDNYRGDAPVEHYLAGLANRTGLRFWQKRARDGKMSPLPDDLAERPAPPENNPTSLLFEMLSELNPEERLVLTLTYYEDKNAKEIAAQMRWSHVATRMRLSRARQRLQTIAKKRGVTFN
ncbi:MAG: sigma-70 family RNA polymerase sigma factor [Planctomycetota bacterium]|jgi:RNA polymerase sigma-70 factor (ECF subfamily)|nr:sigma-70 family RNA polymerase sigma factor [Planctomycetota bacterium]